MVVCVARAAQAAGLGAPVIAAGDEEIMLAAKAHSVRAVFTEAGLPSGSDRVRAAADIIDPERQAQIVVNVQGDMPELEPEHLTQAVAALQADPDADIATLAFSSVDEGERTDENVVKMVLAEVGLAKAVLGKPAQAVGFTRTTPEEAGPFWHHIGIYAFRRAALDRFCDLPPSPLEQSERLEQLRALEDGMKIVCGLVQKDCPGIDSPADLARIRASWKKGQTQ